MFSGMCEVWKCGSALTTPLSGSRPHARLMWRTKTQAERNFDSVYSCLKSINRSSSPVVGDTFTTESTNSRRERDVESQRTTVFMLMKEHLTHILTSVFWPYVASVEPKTEHQTMLVRRISCEPAACLSFSFILCISPAWTITTSLQWGCFTSVLQQIAQESLPRAVNRFFKNPL